MASHGGYGGHNSHGGGGIYDGLPLPYVQGPPKQPPTATGVATAAANGKVSSLVRVRVCDLRILSRHSPSATFAATQEGGVGGSTSFCIDGLFVVLRIGGEVCRTGCLRYADAPTDPTIVDPYRANGEDGEEEEEEDYEGLLSLGTTTTHAESRLPCLVWDECFEFHPEEEGRRDRKPAAADDGPILDLELWRSTPASDNCIGRYTYHVPMETLSYLANTPRQRRRQPPTYGPGPPQSAASFQRMGLPPAGADVSAVVDRILVLQMPAAPPSRSHGLGYGHGSSSSSSGIMNHHHSGGGGSRHGLPPLKLGLRLRVQTVGVPLPANRHLSAGMLGGVGHHPANRLGVPPPLSSPGLGLYPLLGAGMGPFGYGVQGAYPGVTDGVAAYHLFSTTGLLYPSSGGNDEVGQHPAAAAGLVGGGGYESAYGVGGYGAFALHHPSGGGGSVLDGRGPGGGAGPDPFLSCLWTPMALRRSMMSSPQLGGGGVLPPGVSGGGGASLPYLSSGLLGEFPPLMMPATTAALGPQGSASGGGGGGGRLGYPGGDGILDSGGASGGEGQGFAYEVGQGGGQTRTPGMGNASGGFLYPSYYPRQG